MSSAQWRRVLGVPHRASRGRPVRRLGKYLFRDHRDRGTDRPVRFAQPVRVGGLTCDTGPRVGLLVGSRQRMNCVFRSNTTGQQYRYRGRITRLAKLGLDVGIARGGRLFWGVFAPTTHIGPGALRGTYVGAGGNASLGLGLGANVLVGGSHRTISLQPLSVEGQVGINLALGVAGLTLY
jgi:hypothetical protein